MKISIVGGGAHRLLAILRGTLAVPGSLDSGEICLYDLNAGRAEAMGRMLLKTPELKGTSCRVTWGNTLEESLAGADAVGVIMPAGSVRSLEMSLEPSLEHGYISSDNVSPTGAMCGVRVAPILMNIARTMERCCPDAWLVNFVNPVAVLSGMVNNHTRIRAMGVCAGYTNHLWDIPRLFGRDELVDDSELSVQTAGINHLSFVTGGIWQGRDLFEALKQRINENWNMCELQPWWNDKAAANIRNSVSRLVRFWRELGILVFSTEPDGMDHLMYEEAVGNQKKAMNGYTAADIEAKLSVMAADRAEADRTFNRWLDEDLDDRFWDEHWKSDLRFKRADQDIFVRVFSSLAGVRRSKVAVSVPNRGAVNGIKDRHVVEFTQSLSAAGLVPLDATKGSHFEIPDIVHGLASSIAAHQTLLGDALANEDPKGVADALLSYPVRPYSRSARSLYKTLFSIEPGEIAPCFQKTTNYL